MAFVDTRSLADGEVIEADICVIGAGPAGVAIATAFAGDSTRIALLESGDIGYDEETQALAAGEVVGIPYPDLEGVRLRMLGGSTNHWGGNIRPLDAIDFEVRDWVPHSGWPFGLDELLPYYRRAAEFCGVPHEAFEIAAQQSAVGASPWPFADDAVTSQVFQTVGGEARALGLYHEEALEQASNVTTYLFANVVDIKTDDLASKVSELTIKTLNEKTLTARASHYVLAAGGIENPRILLLANKTRTAGLGNQNDLVGRYFMEHLTSPDFAALFPSDPQLDFRFYKDFEAEWGETWGILTLSEDTQRQSGLINARFQAAKIVNEFNKNIDDPSMQSLTRLVRSGSQGRLPDDFGQHLANVIADIDDVAESGYYRLFHHPDYPLVSIDLVVISEQVPNPDSRVYLGEQTDRFGQRQCVLDWRLTDLDSENLTLISEQIQRQFGRSGLGRVRIRLPEGGYKSIDPHPHYHHMGTTRMDKDPTRGVVDANCRLHELPNLFIAGSSVFPTVGNVNPTLTIIALAYRLSDHLKGLKS
ncbi:FAD-dependent oxidoreductase [Pelagibius sp. Alg239-R121]|uniref:FAD-dependent oxidoreductase n=1 Tax=Pelagibius sp. Alg239-R121 TaxID=2993448 RepID=UPI0024A6CF58|nr:GMC family oxidoreductase [Pelagibius sp. Alg239-R121]